MKLALLFVVPFVCLLITNLICSALWPRVPQGNAEESPPRTEDIGNRLSRQHNVVGSAPRVQIATASTNPVEREKARQAIFHPATLPEGRLDEDDEDDGFDPSVHGGLPAGFALSDLRAASD
jgi:hypothetical protein